MAIVKVARSGKSVMFIDDFGNSCITSLVYLRGLLDGSSRSPFVLLKRLPNPVNVDRFMKSPVLEFDASGKVVSTKFEPARTVGGVTASEDALSAKVLKKSDNVRIYNTDIEV